VLFPAWLLVLVAPSREWRERLTTAAAANLSHGRVAGAFASRDASTYKRARRECSFQITPATRTWSYWRRCSAWTIISSPRVKCNPCTFVRTFLRKLGHYAIQSRRFERAFAAGRGNRTRSRARRNPSLYFRKEPSPRRPACGRFTSAHSRRRSRPGGRSCPWRSTAHAACLAMAPGCRALLASQSRFVRRSCAIRLQRDWHEIVRGARCRSGNNCPSRGRTSALISIFPRATTAQKSCISESVRTGAACFGQFKGEMSRVPQGGCLRLVHQGLLKARSNPNHDRGDTYYAQGRVSFGVVWFWPA